MSAPVLVAATHGNSNQELIRRFYDALAALDGETIAASYAPVLASGPGIH